MNHSRIGRACVGLTGLILSGLVARTVYGQANSTQNPPPAPLSAATSIASASPDKVVLRVGEQKVTKADLEFVISNLNPQGQRQVAAQGRRQVGEQYAVMILLSQGAVNQHLDSSPRVQHQLAMQRMQILAQAQYEELARRVKVSPEEASQYYSTHQNEFEEAQVRQVVIRKRPEGAKEGTPGLAPPDAKTRAEAIRKALSSGGDAKKLAQEFQVPNEVVIDVEPRTVRHGGLIPDLDKAAFQLKDGEVSDIADLPQLLAFIQVVGHRSPESKDVSAQIESSLRQQKLEATLDDLKKKATIWMDEEFFAPPSASALPPGLTPKPAAETKQK